ncbi:metallophosphoesterase family protein [Halovenus rubra]|uniref:Metallophosphoesterase family protein n=2 Tax=Halovenus rubra TaxID=869890 RepID=A0ACC7DXQ1_9EURY|nr:metallophosphoesterase [Halovenus rubra]
MFPEPSTGQRDTGGRPAFPASGGAPLSRFARPRGSGTTIALVSDSHLTPTARGSMKVFHRTKQRFQMAIADAHRLDVDGVVVAGDITKDGRADEFRLADTLVETLPEPTVVLPGNHDVGPQRLLSDGAAFGRRYGHNGYPVTTAMGSATVHGVDSTSPATNHDGGATAAPELAELTTQSRPQIAVMHQPLAPIPAPFDSVLPETDYRVHNPKATADALVEAGVELVVTGHLHWPFATTYRGLNVVGAPGCSTFPPSYLLLHIDARGTTVTVVPLAGEEGLTEAYDSAVNDHDRGAVIRSVVQDGYFRSFPQIDKQRPSSRQSGQSPTPTEPTSQTPSGRSG